MTRAAARARRLAPPGNRRWEITLTPVSAERISISLGPTFECTDNGAMCTADGRALSNNVSATVEVPQPSSSVVDGTTLMLAWPSLRDGFGAPATSDYAVTVNGTARPLAAARLPALDDPIVPRGVDPVAAAPRDAVLLDASNLGLADLSGLAGRTPGPLRRRGRGPGAAAGPAAPARPAGARQPSDGPRPADPLGDAREPRSRVQRADLAALQNLPVLRRLDLGGNPTTDLSPLGDVGSLVWLALPGEAVGASADTLGRLTGLRWVWFVETSVVEEER